MNKEILDTTDEGIDPHTYHYNEYVIIGIEQGKRRVGWEHFTNPYKYNIEHATGDIKPELSFSELALERGLGVLNVYDDIESEIAKTHINRMISLKRSPEQAFNYAKYAYIIYNLKYLIYIKTKIFNSKIV